MMELIAQNMAPIIFTSLVIFLLLGYPVAFSLAANGLIFFAIGVWLAPYSEGTITLDKAAKAGAVDVVIDMKSVDTGFAVFNGHIQGEEFLDTAQFPTATFKSTKVVFEGDKPKAIEGNLTIKGVTKPVTLTVTSFQAMPHPMMKKPALGANAFTTIKRTEFNAGKYAPYVGDEVRIDIAIEAVAQ